MNKFMVAAFVIFLWPPFSLGESPVQVDSHEASNFTLSKKLKASIKFYDPTFVVLPRRSFMPKVLDLFRTPKNNQAMFLSVDLNSDNSDDIVLMGVSHQSGKPQIQALLFVSNNNNYKGYLVNNWASKRGIQWKTLANGRSELRGWTGYITHVHPMEMKSHKFPKNHRAFKIEFYGSRSFLYYFSKNKIQQAYPLKK